MCLRTLVVVLQRISLFPQVGIWIYKVFHTIVVNVPSANREKVLSVSVLSTVTRTGTMWPSAFVKNRQLAHTQVMGESARKHSCRCQQTEMQS